MGWEEWEWECGSRSCKIPPFISPRTRHQLLQDLGKTARKKEFWGKRPLQEHDIPNRDLGRIQPRIPLHPWPHSPFFEGAGISPAVPQNTALSCSAFPSLPVMDLMPEAQFSPFFLASSQAKPQPCCHFPHHLPGMIAVAANIPGCSHSSLNPPIHLCRGKRMALPPPPAHPASNIPEHLLFNSSSQELRLGGEFQSHSCFSH